MTHFFTPRKAVAAIATATLLSAASAMAADSTAPATAAFEMSSTTNGKIRAGIKAFKKGDYQRSVTFHKSALKAKMSDRRAAIAQSNLCAAYGQLGELELASEACDTALELRPGYAPAVANREALTIKLAQK